MAFNNTDVSKLNIYALPQNAFESMKANNEIDNDSLYLTDENVEEGAEIFPYVVNTTAFFGTMQKVTVSVSGSAMVFV